MGTEHMDPQAPFSDRLPTLSLGQFGGTGFSIPLPAGDYTYLAQQTWVDFTFYAVDFQVERIPPVVPTPAAWLGGGIGMAILGAARRLRRA